MTLEEIGVDEYGLTKYREILDGHCTGCGKATHTVSDVFCSECSERERLEKIQKYIDEVYEETGKRPVDPDLVGSGVIDHCGWCGGRAFQHTDDCPVKYGLKGSGQGWRMGP